MISQNTGRFTPDYGMRQRNQDCGCQRSTRGGRQGNPQNSVGRYGGNTRTVSGNGNTRNSQGCGCGGNGGSNRTVNGNNNARTSQGCGCGNNSGSDRTANITGGAGNSQGCGCSGGSQWDTSAPQEQLSRDIDQFPVGMTYTPWQTWQNIYEVEYGFQIGTIFGDLDYPFEVGRCRRQ